ncbi:MAG: FliA/WhiG family RNA polymerase sigma factor [Deltaproteobacteria bacterium]|nr:FliA/WhiG family RNA polymerase sigma factor [Deltaproteobacteria bacterium]
METLAGLDRDWDVYFAQGTPVGAMREFVIRSFLPLVRVIARRLKAGLPHNVDFEDLASSGTLGLIAAVDRYRPEAGGSFRKYASIRIRGTMLDELRLMDWAPRSVRRDGGELDSIRRSLEDALGRRPTSDEMASRMGLDSEGFSRLVRRIAPHHVMRFSEMGGDDDRRDPMEVIPDASSPDPLELSTMRDQADRLAAAIEELKDRQRQVISLYYFENLSVKEIALLFGVTEGRVSQLHTEALGRLAKKLRRMEQQPP